MAGERRGLAVLDGGEMRGRGAARLFWPVEVVRLAGMSWAGTGCGLLAQLLLRLVEAAGTLSKTAMHLRMTSQLAGIDLPVP